MSASWGGVREPAMEEAHRLDPRAVLLGAVAWAASWLATAGDGRCLAAGAGALVVLAWVARRRRSRLLAAVTLMGVVALACGAGRAWQLGTGPVQQLASQGATARMEVQVRGGVREFAAGPTRAEAWSADALLWRVEGRGAAWTTAEPVELRATGELVGAWRAVPLGERVAVTGRLAPPDPGDGIAARIRVQSAPAAVEAAGPVESGVARVRAGLREASAGLGPNARALVPALVLGDTSTMPPELTDRFKLTGLTHLTAVSGANLVLLLAFVRTAAVRCRVHGRRLTALLAGTVFVFVALCLGEPSVVRAAAMGLVGLAALEANGRGRQGIRYLAVAVLVLTLWDPWLSRSVGFALSVGASAGLLWWAGRWTDVLARWLPRWLAEAVAVPLAAQLATQPIVTAISGQVSVVGLLANALAGPLVGPATVLGFGAAGLSVLWPMGASGLAWLAGWCAEGLCMIATLCAGLPGAALTWPTTPAAIALQAAMCLLVARLIPLVLARRWLTLLLAAAMVAGLWRTPSPPGWPPARWSMLSCDVGQGDATLFNLGQGRAVLVDAGPDPALLRRCLDQVGVREVPLMFVSHLHADHVTGVSALAGRGVRTVVTSGVRTPVSGEALVDALEHAGAQHVVADAGSRWTVGELTVDVLVSAATADTTIGSEGESSGENDASLVLRLTTGGLTAVVAGDVEVAGQGRAARLGQELDADVLLTPHHGSARQEPAFWAAVSPEIALVSVGAKNDYGHPTAKTLKLAGGLTPNVWRTDQHGALAVARTDGRLVVTAQR